MVYARRLRACLGVRRALKTCHWYMTSATTSPRWRTTMWKVTVNVYVFTVKARRVHSRRDIPRFLSAIARLGNLFSFRVIWDGTRSCWLVLKVRWSRALVRVVMVRVGGKAVQPPKSRL